MKENKIIQIVCSQEFKDAAEKAAKADNRSLSSYGQQAILEKARRDMAEKLERKKNNIEI